MSQGHGESKPPRHSSCESNENKKAHKDQPKINAMAQQWEVLRQCEENF